MTRKRDHRRKNKKPKDPVPNVEEYWLPGTFLNGDEESPEDAIIRLITADVNNLREHIRIARELGIEPRVMKDLLLN